MADQVLGTLINQFPGFSIGNESSLMDAFHQHVQRSQPLCPRCQRLDLSDLVHPNGWDCLAHGRGDTAVRARFDLPPLERQRFVVRPAAMVRDASLTCRFCKLLWGVLTDANGGQEPPTDHDGQPTTVRFRPEPFARTPTGAAHQAVPAYYVVRRLSAAVCPGREGRPLIDNLNEPFPDALVRSYFCFQTCDVKHPHVTDLCDERGVQLRSNMASFSGRMIPGQVDFRLMRWWMQECAERHGHMCSADAASPAPSFGEIRVVDVVADCVVWRDPAADHCRFLALSYCWGRPGVEPLRLLRENKDSLQEPGCLETLDVPRTIRDAMKSTKELGIRYLWVDSLCIMQDSVEDQAHFIPMMDKIYGGAFLTIIAASGEDFNAGLPGVRPDTRQPRQEQVLMWRKVRPDESAEAAAHPDQVYLKRDLLLMTTLRPQGLEQDHYLDDTKWNTRGWTFQERLLSNRCLTFTEQQVYWECQHASWCEESHFDFWCQRVMRYSREPSLRPLPAADATPSPAQHTPSEYEEWSRQLYRFTLTYTRRQLHDQSDYLHAFAGALNGLTSSWGEEFFWGFPRSAFEQHLMWSGGSRGMRHGIHVANDWNGNKFACRFPSWSWLAWVGHVWVPVSNGVTSKRIQIIDQADTEDRANYDLHRPEIVCYAFDIRPAEETSEETEYRESDKRLCGQCQELDAGDECEHMPASLGNPPGPPLRVRPVRDIRNKDPQPSWLSSLDRPLLEANAWRPTSNLEVKAEDVFKVVPPSEWGQNLNSIEVGVFFWASSARFAMSWEKAVPSGELLYASETDRTVVGQHVQPAIVDDNGVVVGHVSPMFEGDFRGSDYDKGGQEFVVIGSFEENVQGESSDHGDPQSLSSDSSTPPSGSVEKEDKTQWLDVILVYNSEVSFYRRGSVGRIKVDAWVRAEREWKLIVLG